MRRRQLIAAAEEKNKYEKIILSVSLLSLFIMTDAQSFNTFPVTTQKPPLHGRHWMAVTGKPLAATAGAMIFDRGGNAVDAACAMLAATCTMWDVLSWGGETQALIYNPNTKKVIAINALGVAPTGATAEFYKSKGYKYPPEYGPLAAVTPGHTGRIDGHACRIRHHEPEGGAGTCHADGRRLSD